MKISLVNHRAIAFAGVMSFAVSAQGATIINPGFEADTVADGVKTTSLTGWTLVDLSGNPSPVTYGALNPSISEYTSEAPEGSNVAYISNGGGRAAGLSQTLATTFQIGADYTLLAQVGNSAAYTGFDGYQVQLLAGTTIIAQDDNSLGISEGTFRTIGVTYTYNATDSALAGQALQIRLYNKNVNFGFPANEVHFDNVTLVPEPSTLALLGLGGLLLARRRRG